MAKDVIKVDGEEKVVREDTAKSFRGVYWALFSVLGFLIIAAIMFFVFSAWSVSDGEVTSPSEVRESR